MIRRLRYGRPIVVVSGLPRSGTSMMMQMLQAGGLALLTDPARQADAHNPRGYFELERVRRLDREDAGWLREARGKAVKIVAPLLSYLPESHDYRVVLMTRELDAVVRSQNAMLAARGEPAPGALADERMRQVYGAHLAEVRNLLARRSCFATLEVSYEAVVAAPLTQSRRLAAFLPTPLDPVRMAAAVAGGDEGGQAL